MPKVYDWQLGRRWSTPMRVPGHKSTWTFSKGQELMWCNNVETKPFGGLPEGLGVKALDPPGRNRVGTAAKPAPTSRTASTRGKRCSKWRRTGWTGQASKRWATSRRTVSRSPGLRVRQHLHRKR